MLQIRNEIGQMEVGNTVLVEIDHTIKRTGLEIDRLFFDKSEFYGMAIKNDSIFANLFGVLYFFL